MVIDAGGIQLLSKYRCSPSSYTRVLTPHSAEAARLLKVSRAKVERDIFWAVEKLQAFGFSILKGPYTKIGCNPIWIAPKGSVKLATAGSGDILAGLIATFLAKDMNPRKSCSLACSIHSYAGENSSCVDSATDLLRHIGTEIVTLRANT